jgi:hypothetical protein
VQELIPPSQRRHARYRYFYAVVFNHRGNMRGSVLLGADSFPELDRLGAVLVTDPDAICGGSARHCTVFPEMCTVSIEIEVFVNGAPRTLPSGSSLGTVARGANHIAVLRRNAQGRVLPLSITSGDPSTLRIPLMAGDKITWN